MDAGGRKVQKQTTQKQPTRNYGDRWQRHVSRKRAACCVSQRKRLDFFVQTQGTVWRGKRDTLLEGHSGFLLFRLAEADGTGTVPCGRPFPYFFFPFFSLFLCCGQDRWQARTIFRGPLVLIVQCSYWNLYTRQSRILGVQKKKKV